MGSTPGKAIRQKALWANSHILNSPGFNRTHLSKEKKQEIRHRALLEAIRFCGGVCAYSKQIKVARSRASNWLNRPEINIPYEYVVLTERITQVSIERLSPFTEEANKAIRRLYANENGVPIPVALNDIKVHASPEGDYLKLKNALIIDTDKVLICGLEKVKACKLTQMKQIDAIVFDLKSLLLGVQPIKKLDPSLLMSERIAIGLRLEELLNNSLGRICDEVDAENNKKIACVIGFENKEHYWLAKKIYLKGNLALLQALDENKISIIQAVEIGLYD